MATTKMQRLTKKYFLSRFILVVGSILLTMILLEIGLRLFHPQLLIWDYRQIWEPVAGVGWHKQPDLDIIIHTAEGDVRLLTDADGYRIGELPQDKSDIHILAVGDSFLEAPQVTYEASMTALLSENLAHDFSLPVTIVNAGVSGWDPNHYRVQVMQALEQSDYDLVLVFIFLQNDLITESIDYFPPTTILSPPFWQANHSLALNLLAIKAQLIAKLRQHSHLYRFGEESHNLILARMGENSDYLPNELLLSEANHPKWQVTTDVLVDIAQMANTEDTAVLFIALPPFYYMDDDNLAGMVRALNLEGDAVDWQQPSRILSQKFTEAGLDFVDVTPTMRAAYAVGNTELYGRIDRHFSPAGHQVVADFLTPIIWEKLKASTTE